MLRSAASQVLAKPKILRKSSSTLQLLQPLILQVSDLEDDNSLIFPSRS